MKIAMVGMGKLGFPVALAWAQEHSVVGYDVSPHAKQILMDRKYPHREAHAQELLEKTTLGVVDTVDEAVAHGDIVFVAVQTPHQPQFEGITRLPDQRADFDYTSLKAAVGAVAKSAKEQKKRIVMVVISTVLPGTTENELKTLLVANEYVSYVYSPMFIAMGTTISDAMDPEMVLLGMDDADGHAFEMMQEFYAPLHHAELLPMRIASAELAKVAYNVFLGLKIVAANSVMEIAQKTDADCDEVTNALTRATDRVISSKYMRGGMGDGGGCHPRDQIALSWLANELNLSYDLFGAMAQAREFQTEWLAELCVDMQSEAATDKKTFLPIVILGKAYKKGTNLTIGSPAILLKNILDEYEVEVDQWDPYIDVGDNPKYPAIEPKIYIIGTDHNEFYKYIFPPGSVVIDPWGKFADQSGVKVIRVGRKP